MKKYFVLLSLMLLLQTAVYAQASLADGDQVDFTIKIDGSEENVTCVRDAIKPEQWYYVPNRPRLVEVRNTKTNKTKPVFALVKYQAKDPDDPENILTGGVLQASVNMALPTTGLDQLKKALAVYTGIAEGKLLIAPLSMSNAVVSVYTPGGEKMGDAPIAPNFGPTFANQSIPVQINLTELGADFSDALVKTGGGILITYVFDYNGLTPKCGFKVTVDWDQTYKHFSTSTKAEASYNSWFWSANAQTDISTVRDDLLTNKCIKVESIAGETFKAEEIDKYLMPILEAINKEIFEIETPDEVEPANAASPNKPSKSWGFSAGVSFSLKDVKKVKKGKTTYSMDRQMIVPRKTVAGGLIGIGDYSKEIQDELITLMPAGNWASGWFKLPYTDGVEDIGITSINLTVEVLDTKGKVVTKVPKQTAVWTESSGCWTDAKKNERETLVFTLADLYNTYKDTIGDFSYKQTMKVTQKIGKKSVTLQFVNTVPMFNGEAAFTEPTTNIYPITINGDFLTWYGDDFRYVSDEYEGKRSDLTAIAVTLKSSSPKNNVTGTITPDITEIVLLLDKGETEDLKVEGSFVFNSKAYKSTLKTKNLLEDMGESIYLTNEDYLPEK